MHVIEAAGFAIVQDDAALIDQRPGSRFWSKLRFRAAGLATVAFYAFIVVIALLSFVRARALRAWSARTRRQP